MTTFLKFNPMMHKGPTKYADPFDVLLHNWIRPNVKEIFQDDLPVQIRPSTNVVETANGFRLEIAVPGLNKEDFKLSLDKDLLTISAKKEVKLEEGEKQVRKEFNFFEFTRSFTIPENIQTDAIEATYENGILNVQLPKKAETEV